MLIFFTDLASWTVKIFAIWRSLCIRCIFTNINYLARVAKGIGSNRIWVTPLPTSVSLKGILVLPWNTVKDIAKVSLHKGRDFVPTGDTDVLSDLHFLSNLCAFFYLFHMRTNRITPVWLRVM